MTGRSLFIQTDSSPMCCISPSNQRQLMERKPQSRLFLSGGIGIRGVVLTACLVWMLGGMLSSSMIQTDRLYGAEITKTQVGIGGLYHVGAWTPLTVEIEDGGGQNFQLEVEAPDPDDNVVTYRGGLVQGENRLGLLFKTGRLDYDLVVRLKDGEGKKVSEKKYRASAKGTLPGALPYSTQIWIGIGNPAGFEEQVTEELADGVVARGLVDHLQDLPTDWSAYESIDAVILAANGADADKQGIMEWFPRGSAQGESLRRWVSGGGVLFLSLGKETERFKESSLGEWFPVIPTAQQLLRTFAPLQAFAGKPIRFDGAVPLSVIESEPRRIVVRGSASPLVIEAPYQFGRVFFCALDLEQQPFVGWEGLSKFYDQILKRGLARPDQQVGGSGSGRLSHGGISEVASQLTRGVATIQGVQRTSLSGNLMLLLLYLLVIGPVDYLIVCRWLKKPELTWITLPLLVGLAGGVGLLYARSSNGDVARTHTVSVIDFDSVSKHVHARNWVSLYSAQTKRTSIAVTPKSLVETTGSTNRLGWWGLPEGTIGGVYRSAGLQLGRRDYQFGPGTDQFDQTPTQIWSTRTFESEWSGESQPIVSSKLESTGVGNLQGSVTWMGEEPLQECMLVYGNRVYFPRGKRGRGEESAELAPNFVWEPSVVTQSTQREFRGFLTKLQTRTVVNQGAAIDSINATRLETVAEAYDISSRNLSDIMPILCFHEYAGGSNYTHLENYVLDEMDWSHHLRMGEAVLYGRIERPAVEIRLDGAECSTGDEHRNSTYIRCLLPVAHVEGRDLRDFVSPLDKLKE